MSEFKNDNLNVKVEKSPGCQVKLTISVAPKAVQAARAKAAKNVSKEVVIPGFRKGKAPNELIEQKFKGAIDEESRSVLLNTAFQEALDLVKIFPLSQKSIKPEIKSLSNETGAEIVISYETQPEIPEIDSSGITLKNVPVKPVTQEDIDDRFHELQMHQATFEEIKDRGIQDGDYAHLDIESLDQPGVVVCKNQPFAVTKKGMGSWLYNLLLNKNAHDVFEGTSEKESCHACDDPAHFPGHVHHEEEFKPSRLKITVQSVKKAHLPEINTEFATKIGAESPEQLKERVITSLANNFKENAQADLREQMREAILKKYSFDIPASLLNAYGSNLGEKERAEILNNYRLYFIVEKLAHQLDLNISQDEIMQEYMVQTYMTRPEDSFLNPNLDPKEVNHRIRSHLLEKKVSDYLIEKAQKA